MLKNRLSSMAHAVAVLFAITVVLALGQHTHAKTKTWTGGGGDTSWHNPDNWSPVGVPRETMTVTYLTGTSSINSLDSEENLTVSGGTLQLTTTFIFSTNSVTDLSGFLSRLRFR